MDFTFPQLTQSEGTKVPLTAKSTVQHAGSACAAPAPVKAPTTGSNLEHRNKGDPLLTRLLYGFLARLANVPLEKGYSQVDWMRVSRSTQQPRLRKDISWAEVKQHRTPEDAWMVFKNRVYNITPYLKYHPGGAKILLSAAGRDGTALFMKHHPWVNIDALMEKCLVGWLAQEDGAEPALQQGAAAPLQQPQEQEPDGLAGVAASAGSFTGAAQPGVGRAGPPATAAGAGGLVLREAAAAPPPGGLPGV